MGSLSSNKYGAAYPAIESSGAGEPVILCPVVTVTVASGKLTDGDILKLCVIPAGHKVTDLKIACGDLDAATALIFDVGLMDATDTVLDTVFVSGSDIGQAGGLLNVPATATMINEAAASVDKVLAVEVTTSAGTIHAAERTFNAIVTYVAT